MADQIPAVSINLHHAALLFDVVVSVHTLFCDTTYRGKIYIHAWPVRPQHAALPKPEEVPLHALSEIQHIIGEAMLVETHRYDSIEEYEADIGLHRVAWVHGRKWRNHWHAWRFDDAKPIAPWYCKHFAAQGHLFWPESRDGC